MLNACAFGTFTCYWHGHMRVQPPEKRQVQPAWSVERDSSCMHSWSKKELQESLYSQTHKVHYCEPMEFSQFSRGILPRARSPRSGPSAIPTSPSASMLPASAPPVVGLLAQEELCCSATTKLLALTVAYHSRGISDSSRLTYKIPLVESRSKVSIPVLLTS